MRFDIKPVFCFFISAALLSGCSEHTSISSICEKDKKDNYILKWEVFPERDSARLEIFASDNDSIFSRNPVRTMYVNDYIAVINPDKDVVREFFKLKVGRTTSGIISNRAFEMDSIQNLRDAGGYFTRANNQVRWGKIYRSGHLARLSPNDEAILNSLRIKTVIDMRSERQSERNPDTFKGKNYISLPIDVNNFDQEISRQIFQGRFLKGDAHIYTQDCYRNIIDKYPVQYAQFFDILTDESNYPVLFHCGYGKDRTGLASYFLLKALDVPDDVIEEDFLLSNKHIDRLRMMKGLKDLPESMLEAITTLGTADLSQLKYAISCMKKKSGSVEDYMQKELNITPEKKARLKEILLYN